MVEQCNTNDKYPLHFSAVVPARSSEDAHLSLSDVTNISSFHDKKNSMSQPVLNIEERTGAPNCKRRCTVSVNYKEPSISGLVYLLLYKLLRGLIYRLGLLVDLDFVGKTF